MKTNCYYCGNYKACFSTTLISDRFVAQVPFCTRAHMWDWITERLTTSLVQHSLDRHRPGIDAYLSDDEKAYIFIASGARIMFNEDTRPCKQCKTPINAGADPIVLVYHTAQKTQPFMRLQFCSNECLDKYAEKRAGAAV